MEQPEQREEALFEAALKLPACDRAAYLDDACAGNAELRRRVEVLLGAFERASGFMKEPAWPAGDPTRRLPQPPTEKPGDRIGRYKLLEQIGEGGCGVVYMAEQQVPVRRRVALKVIKLGMDTRQVVARFEAERQALAMMDHPNIARVLDAGSTDSGRPFFVMELVRGVKITEFCDRKKLSTEARLKLFIQVCQAVQHAHQKGIIHRDIKPSNILVTIVDGAPVPKVIDFGIAKATSNQPLTDKTLFTAFEQFIGTPAYMSPEQAEISGVDVDTRTDLYSLGVVLYELLTGKTPFDAEELLRSGIDQIRRTIREQEPPKPSTRLHALPHPDLTTTAQARQTDEKKLLHSVSGDLDWIVMKCLEKERSRRYETVNGLAADIQRHLNNEPVVARPPSRLYEFQRTVRRHKFGFAAAAAVTLALAVGLGIAMWTLAKEQRARQEQARLRIIAEAARAREAKLREYSSLRENIARVAVMISEGKLEEADAQLQFTPLSSIEPSLEAADVLRSLGGWNAMRGRWAQASECFLLLTEANRLSSADNLVSKFDIVAAGPALAENGNTSQYDRFRKWTINRLGNTSKTLHAQQVIGATLLLPADEEFLQKLIPLGKLLEESSFGQKLGIRDWEIEFASWRAWALSLLAYRQGDYNKAIQWGRKAADLPVKKTALFGVIHSVLAMAYHQQEDKAKARDELEKVRVVIDAVFTPDLPPSREPMGANQGYWWDWIQARILYRQARTLIEGQATSK